MSADGDIVRAALEYAKRALDQIWDEGGTNQGLHIDPSLAALARLEVAEARTCDFGCGPMGEEYVEPGVGLVPLCPVHGWVCVLLDARDERIGAAEAQRDALAEALREIRNGRRRCRECGKVHVQGPPRGSLAGSWADPDDGHAYQPVEIKALARAALAEAGLKAEVGGVDYSRMDPP